MRFSMALMKTLHKVCNHPNLVTSDYSELITNEMGEEKDFDSSGRKK